MTDEVKESMRQDRIAAHDMMMRHLKEVITRIEKELEEEDSWSSPSELKRMAGTATRMIEAVKGNSAIAEEDLQMVTIGDEDFELLIEAADKAQRLVGPEVINEILKGEGDEKPERAAQVFERARTLQIGKERQQKGHREVQQSVSIDEVQLTKEEKQRRDEMIIGMRRRTMVRALQECEEGIHWHRVQIRSGEHLKLDDEQRWNNCSGTMSMLEVTLTGRQNIKEEYGVDVLTQEQDENIMKYVDDLEKYVGSEAFERNMTQTSEFARLDRLRTDFKKGEEKSRKDRADREQIEEQQRNREKQKEIDEVSERQRRLDEKQAKKRERSRDIRRKEIEDERRIMKEKEEIRQKEEERRQNEERRQIQEREIQEQNRRKAEEEQNRKRQEQQKDEDERRRKTQEEEKHRRTQEEERQEQIRREAEEDARRQEEIKRRKEQEDAQKQEELRQKKDKEQEQKRREDDSRKEERRRQEELQREKDEKRRKEDREKEEKRRRQEELQREKDEKRRKEDREKEEKRKQLEQKRQLEERWKRQIGQTEEQRTKSGDREKPDRQEEEENRQRDELGEQNHQRENGERESGRDMDSRERATNQQRHVRPHTHREKWTREGRWPNAIGLAKEDGEKLMIEKINDRMEKLETHILAEEERWRRRLQRVSHESSHGDFDRMGMETHERQRVQQQVQQLQQQVQQIQVMQMQAQVQQIQTVQSTSMQTVQSTNMQTQVAQGTQNMGHTGNMGCTGASTQNMGYAWNPQYTENMGHAGNMGYARTPTGKMPQYMGNMGNMGNVGIPTGNMPQYMGNIGNMGHAGIQTGSLMQNVGHTGSPHTDTWMSNMDHTQYWNTGDADIESNIDVPAHLLNERHDMGRDWSRESIIRSAHDRPGKERDRSPDIIAQEKTRDCPHDLAEEHGMQGKMHDMKHEQDMEHDSPREDCNHGETYDMTHKEQQTRHRRREREARGQRFGFWHLDDDDENIDAWADMTDDDNGGHDDEGTNEIDGRHQQHEGARATGSNSVGPLGNEDDRNGLWQTTDCRKRRSRNRESKNPTQRPHDKTTHHPVPHRPQRQQRHHLTDHIIPRRQQQQSHHFTSHVMPYQSSRQTHHYPNEQVRSNRMKESKKINYNYYDKDNHQRDVQPT